jgi:hypothetical protein
MAKRRVPLFGLLLALGPANLASAQGVPTFDLGAFVQREQILSLVWGTVS